MRNEDAKEFYVYILASAPHGVLYVGMTSDLSGRIWQHRERVLDGFTKQYWTNRLVYYEHHHNGSLALRREWLLKRWRRDWKIKLIETSNPTWADLFETVVRTEGFEL
jgi:putative endonuclease